MGDWQARDLAYRFGIRDGKQTEITGGDLTEGMALITEQRTGASAGQP